MKQITAYSVVGMILSILIGFYALFIWLYRKSYNSYCCITLAIDWWNVFFSSLFAIQVEVTKPFFNHICIYLTDMVNPFPVKARANMEWQENNKTDTIYENSLVIKVMMLKFVSNYTFLIYIAYFQTSCAHDTCIGELSTAVAVIAFIRCVELVDRWFTFGRILLGNVVEIIVPSYLQHRRKKMETEGIDPSRRPSDTERQFVLRQFHPIFGPMENYGELLIQYGYVVMFAPAFPLVVAYVFLSNFVELRVGGWKLCQQSRRPDPRSKIQQ